MSVFRVHTEELTPALVAKARKELRETPEVKQKALEELRALLKNEKNLYFADRDEILVRYLRPVKFYPESALALVGIPRAAALQPGEELIPSDSR